VVGLVLGGVGTITVTMVSCMVQHLALVSWSRVKSWAVSSCVVIAVVVSGMGQVFASVARCMASAAVVVLGCSRGVNGGRCGRCGRGTGG